MWYNNRSSVSCRQKGRCINISDDDDADDLLARNCAQRVCLLPCPVAVCVCPLSRADPAAGRKGQPGGLLGLLSNVTTCQGHGTQRMETGGLLPEKIELFVWFSLLSF